MGGRFRVHYARATVLVEEKMKKEKKNVSSKVVPYARGVIKDDVEKRKPFRGRRSITLRVRTGKTAAALVRFEYILLLLLLPLL